MSASDFLNFHSEKPFCYFVVNHYTTHTNLQINLIAPCTNKCWCCFRNSPFARSKTPIHSTQELMKILQERQIQRIVVSALGEPTLFKHLVPLINLLSKHTSDIVLVTNGTKSSAVIEQVIDKLSILSISLHGNRCTHTCTTRSQYSFDSLIKFKQSMLELKKRHKLSKLEIVSSTLLTRELLNQESEYLDLLTASDLARPSRLLFPASIKSLNLFLNVPSYIETSFILQRFGQLHKNLQYAQEDRYIPQCTTFYSSPVQLNLCRYLKNWSLDICLENCSHSAVCSGVNTETLQFRDIDNLNAELQFLHSEIFRNTLVHESFKIDPYVFKIPCLSYECIILQALRTFFNDSKVFVSPIETYYTHETYEKIEYQCIHCKHSSICSAAFHSFNKFKNTPYIQYIYKTQFLYDLIQSKKSTLKAYYKYLLDKHQTTFVELQNEDKLLVDAFLN